MCRQWIGLNAIGIVLAASLAAAQTSSFDQLSPGNQKIAQALFQSQQPPLGALPLTRDDIAAMKVNSGKGWGEIFQSLKAQGYFQQKNMGQVVSRFNHQPPAAAAPTITTGSGKTNVMGSPASAAGSTSAASGARGGHAGNSGTSAGSAGGMALEHAQGAGGSGSGHGAPRSK